MPQRGFGRNGRGGRGRGRGGAGQNLNAATMENVIRLGLAALNNPNAVSESVKRVTFDDSKP
jgi:hypothetical protein